MADPAPLASPEDFAAIQERVLAIVRELAAEVGGSRALRAVAPRASLERDLGLGSLERVELLLRLEKAFGRSLDEAYLQLDTPDGLARALLEAGGEESGARPERGTPPPPRSARARPFTSRSTSARAPIPTAPRCGCGRTTDVRTRSPTAGSGRRRRRWQGASARGASGAVTPSP
jgi:acyl carrier protein